MSASTIETAATVESSEGLDPVEATAITAWAAPLAPMAWRPSRMVRACERGMATAEYAIGILAAICVALTLAKFITGAEFLTPFTKQITQLIGQVGAQIKVK